jgi:alginate O-acetyltransferase complex protein AlgI
VLFNSYTYLLIFLPLVVSGYYFLLPFHTRWRVIWLALSSLYFYADWSAKYLPLLLASTLFNFGIGKLIEEKTRCRLFMLRVGVCVNLALLIALKYTNFIFAQLNQHLYLAFPQTDIVLPIGISFFTFTQIAYLIDLSRGICGRYDLWRYVLFVSFFPHLLAGPILHHKEMMPQFAHRLKIVTYERQIGYGLLIFAIGLYKKVCLADSVAPFANAAFNAADGGATLSLASAWWGALAYTLQLYFDFSGYSDMAIGSARLFGIRLPLNFNAPYRAANIIEFWRRWHMTLSRFLRDYLYFSLGGNRLGPVRRYINLMLTMTLGGIWHGAGYGFALWGLLHGAYLVFNHAWRALRCRIPIPKTALEEFGGCAITFIAVVIGWVLFRASSFEGAERMFSAMAGLSGADSSDVSSAVIAGTNILGNTKLSTLLLSMLNLETITVP